MIRRRRTWNVCAATTVAVLAVLACATRPVWEVDALIESAESAPDHLRLAALYREEAAKLRAQSVEHRRRADLYAGQTYKRSAFAARHREHCWRLAAAAEDAALEYDELALEHERAANR